MESSQLKVEENENLLELRLIQLLFKIIMGGLPRWWGKVLKQMETVLAVG